VGNVTTVGTSGIPVRIACSPGIANTALIGIGITVWYTESLRTARPPKWIRRTILITHTAEVLLSSSVGNIKTVGTSGIPVRIAGSPGIANTAIIGIGITVWNSETVSTGGIPKWIRRTILVTYSAEVFLS